MVGVNAQITQEDEFLVGNPQITYFKAVYRRHSHFAIQQVETSPQGTINANGESEVVYKIDDGGGHLLSRCWLEVELLPTPVGNSEAEYLNWTNNTGHAFLEYCKLKIGGQIIDEHSGLYLDVYNELNDKDESEHLGLNKHVCKNTYLRSNRHTLKPINLIIPFKFWFNKNPGLALPLISLDNSNVEFVMKFRNVNNLINISNNYQLNGFIQAPVVKFFNEIIYLSAAEAKRFKQNRHEYLIETVQEEKNNLFSTNVITNFSHPVKELIWVIRHNDRFSGTTPGPNSRVDATINRSYNSNSKVFQPPNPMIGNLTNTNNNNNLTHTDELRTQGNDYFEYCCGALGERDAGGVNVLTRTNVNQRHGGTNMYGFNDNGCDWFDKFQLDFSGAKCGVHINASYLRTSNPVKYGHKLPNKHVYSYSFSLSPDEYTPSGHYNFSNSSSQKLNFTFPITNSNIVITIFAINYNIFRIMSGKAALIFTQ